MNNHLQYLLERWYPHRDELGWVLASVTHTDGSAYRKAGAMMLINSLGQYFGMLSGGCLEEDLLMRAKRCLEEDDNHTVVYDLREGESAAELGLGCGGRIEVLLQPVSKRNGYLQLSEVLVALHQRHAGRYFINLDAKRPDNLFVTTAYTKPQQHRWIDYAVEPPLHLGIFGGGIDALPVCNMARQLGWQVTVFDPRPRYARQTLFSQANHIVRQGWQELANEAPFSTLNAGIIMSHNVTLDAQALVMGCQSPMKYMALLGPLHRRDKILQQAGLAIADLPFRFASPAGLRLGGELPESIALAMLAEIHAFFEEKDGHSISNVLVS